MRRLFPEINTEIDAVERSVERLAFAEAVMPPMETRSRVVQRIEWNEGYNNTKTGSNTNFYNINLNGDHQNSITVHKWWRIAFVSLVVLSKIFLFLAILYYLKFKQIAEQAAQTPAKVEQQQVQQSSVR